MPDTLWCDFGIGKLLLQSGQFTSTIKTSQAIGSVDATPSGISWDEVNTPWCGAADDRLYLQSGLFSSTIKTSQAANITASTFPFGISWDGVNTPWCGTNRAKLWLMAGQFSSSILVSLAVGGIDTPSGISWDGINTPWCGGTDAKLYLQSGFTGTLKNSQGVGSVDSSPSGISWDAVNVPWCGLTDDKLYLQSSFSSTLKTSLSVGAPTGIEHGDYTARVSTIGREINDTVSVSDQLTGALTLGRGVDDTVSVLDQLVAESLYGRELADAVTVSDSLSAGLDHEITIDDTAAVTDSLAHAFTASATLTDSITVRDEIEPQGVGLLEVLLAPDPIAATDLLGIRVWSALDSSLAVTIDADSDLGSILDAWEDGMASSSYFKQGDTSPAFVATLRDSDGVVVNISGATARFLMRNRRTRVMKVAAAATVVDGAGGRVSYNWAAGDTDTPGGYEVEIEITFGDGTVRTFPSDGYHALTVLDDLG